MGLKQGSLISPKLFTSFINELASMTNNSGVSSIQIGTNKIEVLMFANDVGLRVLVGSNARL